MKDLLLGVHFVVKTLKKFQVVVWQTKAKNFAKVEPHVHHDYFSSFNQSDHCFLALSLPLLLPSSLLKVAYYSFIRVQEVYTINVQIKSTSQFFHN